MTYPVNPTEFRTTPHGTIDALDRFRFATFGFTGEITLPALPLLLVGSNSGADFVSSAPVRELVSSSTGKEPVSSSGGKA